MSSMLPGTSVMQTLTGTGGGTRTPYSSTFADLTNPTKADASGAGGTTAPLGSRVSRPGGVGGIIRGSGVAPAMHAAPGIDPAAGAAAPGAAPTYGTESGPGILDQWFNERATGSDPGWDYGVKRGMTALDNGYAARGGYNSGAAMQGEGDFMSNALSQREGQLDSLASGASGERAQSLNSMLGLGTGLANGQAGLGAAYDIGGANAMSGANSTGLGLGAQGIGLQYGANQNFMNNLLGLGTVAALS